MKNWRLKTVNIILHNIGFDSFFVLRYPSLQSPFSPATLPYFSFKSSTFSFHHQISLCLLASVKLTPMFSVTDFDCFELFQLLLLLLFSVKFFFFEYSFLLNSSFSMTSVFNDAKLWYFRPDNFFPFFCDITFWVIRKERR